MDAVVRDAEQELLQSSKFLNWRKKRPRDIETDIQTDIGKTVNNETIVRPIRPRKVEKSNLMLDEKHYTPQELADAWGVSTETIRQIFREEQGVLKIGNPHTRTKRGYFTLRIPREVAERVHRRLSA
jgi:hypothetical protein